MRKIFGSLAIIVLAGCTSAGTLPGGGGGGGAIPHLWIGNDNAAGALSKYGFPLTAASTPILGVASANNTTVAFDAAGDMVTGDFAGHLTYFAAPLTAASVPAASFNNGAAPNNGQIAFNGAGLMAVGSSSTTVNLFTPPLTAASVPSSTVAGFIGAVGVAFDTANKMYVADAGVGTAITCSSGAGTCSAIDVYSSPYTGAPVTAALVPSTFYRKIALSSTQLFVANVGGATGSIDVYTLPITAVSVKAFSITNGANDPEALAIDAAGNLYAGNLGNATAVVYAPPFSAASAPTVTLSLPGEAIFGMAISPN